MKFAQRFPGLEKVWKMEITSGKMEFFFESYNECFTLNFFFRFGQILIDLARMFEKKALFPRFLRSLLITNLITVSVEKESIVLKKVLNFESTTPSTLL